MIIATARNVATATIDLGESRARPQTPWPLVQPEPSPRAAADEKTGKRKRPKARFEMNNRPAAKTQTVNHRSKTKPQEKEQIACLMFAGAPHTPRNDPAYPRDTAIEQQKTERWQDRSGPRPSANKDKVVASCRLYQRWYGAGGEGVALSALSKKPMECPMPQSNDLSRSFTALNQDNTLIVVIEMSQSSWLVAGMVPGVERQPLKKLEPGKDQLLKLLNRWRQEALRAGHAIERMVVAYEAGRDGFWLARWLRERGVEAYVMHPSSVAVSREHRRAKTDRLDTELLMRAFLGWLRGERRHCSMAAIPTIEEEDAKRPNREHEKLVGDRTRIVN